MEPAAAVPLPSTVHDPGLARGHVRDLGASWPPDVLDAALLVVTEAVTNAVRYGQGRIELAVRLENDCIRIEVRDANPQPPHQRAPQADGLGEGGRGLYLLDALTQRWGVDDRLDPPGKTLWMQIPRS